MTKVSNTKYNHELITKNTEKVDAILSVTDIQVDIDNVVLYGKSDESYSKSLRMSIKNIGLKAPILVYPKRPGENTHKLKSGHTRLEEVINLGHDTIPVQISITEEPASGYDNMIALQEENQGRPANLKRQYNQINQSKKAYTAKTGMKCSDTVLRNQICPAVQMSWNMYETLRWIDENPDPQRTMHYHLNRILDTNGSELSPGKAKKMMQQDIKMKNNKKTLAQSKILDDVIERSDISYAVNVVSNIMNQLDNITYIGKDGQSDIPAFADIQQNILGGVSHEIFANAIVESINHTYNQRDTDKAFAIASKQQRLEDIHLPWIQGQIEVKTCIIKDGNKLKFTTRTPKTGYYLLVGFTPDYEDVYCSYGYLNEKVWKVGHGAQPSTMIIPELEKQPMNDIIGKLKVDKNTKKVHCIPASLYQTINVLQS